MLSIDLSPPDKCAVCGKCTRLKHLRIMSVLKSGEIKKQCVGCIVHRRVLKREEQLEEQLERAREHQKAIEENGRRFREAMKLRRRRKKGLFDHYKPSHDQPPRFEDYVKSQLRSAGFSVLHSGWPDFMCFRTVRGPKIGSNQISSVELFVLECKQGSDKLRKEQRTIIRLLRMAGINVHIVHPGNVDKVLQLQKGRLKRKVSELHSPFLEQ